MLRSLLLLGLMLMVALRANYIFLAVLASLAVVAWNMAEKQAFATFFGLRVMMPLCCSRRSCSLLCGISPRASSLVVVEQDQVDTANGDGRKSHDATLPSDPDVVVCCISGVFFFGAAATVSAALDRIGEYPKAQVLDLSAVPVTDSSAAATIDGFVRKSRWHGGRLYRGVEWAVRRVLLTSAYARRACATVPG